MLTQSPINPSLKDTLDALRKDIFLNMNCQAIGKIETFDKDNQTCEISIMYSKKYYSRNEKGEMVSKLVPYPLLVDCPIVCITGGSAGLTMPIKKDDECLVLFNDRDIDNWFKGGKSGDIATSRAHSLADGIALVGIRSLENLISNYDPDNPVLFNESTKITVKSDKIKIENSTATLNDLLQELILEIKTLVTTNAIVGVPSTLSPATIVKLEVVGAKIGGLLE